MPKPIEATSFLSWLGCLLMLILLVAPLGHLGAHLDLVLVKAVALVVHLLAGQA